MIVALLLACGTLPKRINRDTQTYTVEIFAGLQREEKAAEALLKAASAAAKRGDLEACEDYAAPALLIQTKAQKQAYRALWLAGLPYPNKDGSVPDPKVKQPDPGAADKVAAGAAMAHCKSQGGEIEQ